MPEMITLPSILLIDNESSERVVGIRARLAGRANVRAIDPLDVEPEDLADADLVSVDEFLGDDWDTFVESDARALPASVRNRDGLAVAASVRSQVRFAGTRPLAITLHTGEIDKLAGALPRANREPLVAAQHDLEWVFQFEADFIPDRLLAFAEAARSLVNAANIVADDFGARWLQVPRDAPWGPTAIAQIEDARPPAHSLAQDTAGRSYLRWLAHRVLPYPTFLLNRAHAANLLGIQETSFDLLAERAHAYDGPLRGLLGDRWWRASLQQLLVDHDVNTWDSTEERATALSVGLGLPLVPLSEEQAVVSYTAEGTVADIDTDPDESVRLQMDGWPVWADDPWALVETVRSNLDLRRTVSHVDRARIESA